MFMTSRLANAVQLLDPPCSHGDRARYRVWAPRAASLALELNGEQVSMYREDGGWWSADPQMRPGDRYGFKVNGGPPLPDPRSARQPSGVHGLSEVIDHAAYRWTDTRWQAPPLSAA